MSCTTRVFLAEHDEEGRCDPPRSASLTHRSAARVVVFDQGGCEFVASPRLPVKHPAHLQLTVLPHTHRPVPQTAPQRGRVCGPRRERSANKNDVCVVFPAGSKPTSRDEHHDARTTFCAAIILIVIVHPANLLLL